MFKDKFDSFALAGEYIRTKIDGFDIVATIERDDDSSIDDDDCHNIDQSVTGCDDEQFAKLLAARHAWQNDEWFYCGIVLSVSRDGIELDCHASSMWSIECNYPNSDNSYLSEVTNELLDDALAAAKKAVVELKTAVSKW